MTDDERLTLIHTELDGELDGGKRGELARVLLAEPQTRALHDQLRQLCDRLDALEGIEPPPQLKEAILERLPPATAEVARKWQPARWRYAALIAGFLAGGGVLYEIAQGPSPGSGETAGTMAAHAPVPVDSVALDQGPVTGRVSLFREGDGLVVALDVASAEPIDVLIESEGYSFRINNLESPPSGPAHQTVALKGVGLRGQDIELTFLTGAYTVSRATLRAPAGH